MTNQYFKAAKTVEAIKIQSPKLQIVTKGYINLISRAKVEIKTVRKTVTVKIYKSRKALKFSQLSAKLFAKAKQAKIAGQAFLQSCLLESTVNRAKQAMRDARRAFLTSGERFTLYVDFCRALANLRTFKFSLPKTIRLNLF